MPFQSPTHTSIQAIQTSTSKQTLYLSLVIHAPLKLRSIGITLTLMTQLRVGRKRIRRIEIIRSNLFPRSSRGATGPFNRLRL